VSNPALIIALGNLDRGDDAAGLLVARRLRELGIGAREHTGEGLALLESWSGAAHVILIDTVLTGAPAGTIARFDGREARVVRDKLRASTHAFGVAEALELGRVLGRLPESVTIYGIEGEQFDPGSRPSEAVLAAVEMLAMRISTELAT
jgi:hydrogenase maturation protease